MRYVRVELDLNLPLGPIELEEGFDGAAFLVRHAGRPVGFWMEKLTERTLSAERLERLVRDHVELDLVHSALDTRLTKADTPRFRESTPRLTVAICTRDRAEWVKRCLNSVQKAIAQESGADQVELLVVDNASADESTRIAAETFPGVHYVRETVPGLDFARNRALAEATGELVAFLDDDVVVDRGWLQGLRSVWADFPDAGGFAGLVLPLELQTNAQVWFERRGGFARGFRRVCYHEGWGGDPRFPLSPGMIGTGANMAVNRALALELGGFDEALDTGPPLPGGGDLDMFYRIIRAGRDLVYEPSYFVFHEHRRELDALRRQLQSWGTGSMAMLTKIYELEPSQRRHIRAHLAWWFGDQARRFGSSLVKRKLPTGLVLDEFLGGVRGLLGEYSRSQKRVQRRKQQYA